MTEEQLRKELDEAKQLIKLLKEEVGFAERGYTQKPWVKTYAGGKPNYCTPEVTPEVPCKTDPRAPHGFDRNASHSADRYVCECEGWEPDVGNSAHEAENVYRNVDNVNMSEERVHKSDKSIHEPFIYIRADTEMPFGGYEHCGQHDPGAFPVYTAPPKKEWVGLDGEIPGLGLVTEEFYNGMLFAEDYLREKNGG